MRRGPDELAGRSSYLANVVCAVADVMTENRIHLGRSEGMYIQKTCYTAKLTYIAANAHALKKLHNAIRTRGEY